MIIDRRQFEREDKEVQAQYIFKNETLPCTVTDVSDDGLGLTVEAKLSQGAQLKILFPGHEIAAKVIYVDGHSIGVKFEKTPKETVEFIRALRQA